MHEEDLIGSILKLEPVVEFRCWDDLKALESGTWLHLNFEALKSSPKSEIDPREEGEALWPERQSRELLLSKRRLDPLRFETMYQGHPSSSEGLLYGDNFSTYDTLPEDIVRRANYTDTADLGDDYLCSISYLVDADGVIYVTDVVYSRESMDVTEQQVAQMLERSSTRESLVESNNGGRGFARALQRLCRGVKIECFINLRISRQEYSRMRQPCFTRCAFRASGDSCGPNYTRTLRPIADYIRLIDGTMLPMC